MKRTSIAVSFLLILSILVSCSMDGESQISGDIPLSGEEPMEGEYQMLSNEELTDIFYSNRDVINRIKDGLFSSGFVPHGGFTESGRDSSLFNDIVLYYDFETGELYCSEDPQGEKLQMIESIHGDAIAYFLYVGEEPRPSIDFREVSKNTIVEFFLRVINQ